MGLEQPHKVETPDITLGMKFILLIYCQKASKKKNNEGQGLCPGKYSVLDKAFEEPGKREEPQEDEAGGRCWGQGRKGDGRSHQMIKRSKSGKTMESTEKERGIQ